MPANYTLLEKISVGAAGASSVTFSGIPQTGYTDLVVKASTRSGSGGSVAYSMYMKINSLTSSIYSQRALEGNGASAISFSQSGADSAVRVALLNGTGATSNTFSTTDIYIPNYTSSNYKSVSIDTAAETNATTTYENLIAYLVQTTDAVTSLTFTTEGIAGSFAQYSTFYLYGVAKLGTTPAIVPYATGGDTIMTDGTYWYHAFKASGTFTPTKLVSCDVLVVAGGGAGGNFAGAGGGAGGLLVLTSQSISTTQTVTIGAGGAGVTPGQFRGNSGSDSVFGSNTATGGGGGGSGGSTGGNGKNGGSGGGAGGGGGSPGTGTGGTGVSGQGFRGGNASGAGDSGAAGGGGASVVGANGTGGETGGNGGNGSNAYSTWASVTGTGASGYYAGGGGGGTGTGVGGGSGGLGGGTGGHSGTDATANTGGGGGGRWNSGTSSAGGSGLVIVRYAI